MSLLVETVRECIIVASIINPLIERERYLRELVANNDECNYLTFYSFEASCSSTLLGMLFACGHFKSDQRLCEIAVDIVEARRLFGENEPDIGNHVRDMFLTSSLSQCFCRKRRASKELFPEQTISPPALRHSNNEKVEETLRNDTTHSSSAVSNYTTREEMHDIEEASAEEAQHSRLHAKPFDIRFLFENYHVVQQGGGGEQSDFHDVDKHNEKEEEDVIGEGGEQSNAPETTLIRANISETDYKLIQIYDERMCKFRKFNILGREARIKIRPPPDDNDIVLYLENAFREIYAYAVNSVGLNDYVGLSFASADLTRRPAGLSFRPARDLSYGDIWNLVSSLVQSAGGHDILEHFTVNVFNVTLPSGQGAKPNKLTHEGVAKRSILIINNIDNLCFPRSLVAAMIYSERGNVRTGELHAKWNTVRKQNSVMQQELALELTRKAGVSIPDEGCNIPEFERFQLHLARYDTTIIVYNFRSFARGAPPLYDGSGVLVSLGRAIRHKLNIMYYERSRHFNPILNLRAASGSRGYCVRCNRGYKPEKGHRCSNACLRCFAVPSCEETVQLIHCSMCQRAFYGSACFERHRAPKSYNVETTSSVCSILRICNKCGHLQNSRKKHKCSMIYCRICVSSKPLNHLCFIRPLRHTDGLSKNPTRAENTSETATETEDENNKNVETCKRKKGRVAFVFYDFETRQDDVVEGSENVKTHVVTLCVAQQICDSCIEIDDMTVRCRWCGVRELIFRNDPVKQFVDFVTRPTKSFQTDHMHST
ncbi:uncharacterized protein LOC112588681 [Harpegnathos saltator]|uniref:uncharacterized protein LOC112588681 n=1 Tax=Harpegnathos saltator TaxID=610380 RepID=UPI000DBEE8D0|nr:uncharacterized protein LOC112588681 [Harpegnathos saltator]